MYENMKIYNYENMEVQIWKYTNIHVEKCKCRKCKRVRKEIKYIYIKL